MSCGLVSELAKLRKSSRESIDNAEFFDQFKDYMHVEREVERELRSLLCAVNESSKKCLIMLCGSAGDGKSHLIAYMKKSDKEKLLDNYDTYNDATESSAPTLTAIDTLSEKLSAFNDENIMSDDSTRMIIAINLGTLNNFIESKEGLKFTKLKEYVMQNGIFSDYNQKNEYKIGSVFQHVSFSDYQVFSLSSNGVKTDFIEGIFDKVFNNTDSNPFFKEYKNCSSCPLRKRCPVCHNYEYLQNGKHRQSVAHRIVEIVIEDKAIVSTREMLNLVYDIIVHPGFSYESLAKSVKSDLDYLTNYINWSTPMLLNEFEGISPLLDMISKHDVLKTRVDSMDEKTTRFHSMENIEKIFVEITKDTPYGVLNEMTNVSNFGGIKPELKKSVYKFLIRLEEMNNIALPNIHRARLNEYVSLLYCQHSGKNEELGTLFDMTKHAIMNWDGRFDDDYICIDDSNEKFWILEQLLLEPYLPPISINEGEVIQRFSPELKVGFLKEDSETEPECIGIDFSLYELISDMENGYRPTIQDKNYHTDFVSYIKKLIEFGNKSKKIIIVSKHGTYPQKTEFSKTTLEYKFKVV